MKIGFIGLGKRGIATLERYMLIGGVEITGLCDIDIAAIDNAKRILGRQGFNATVVSADWRDFVRHDSFSMVYICTDWASHAPISIHAMYAGKDVAVEVPAATTVDDCFRIAATARETGRMLAMMENCCFDPFALNTLRAVEAGIIGEPRHCEGAYIHELRELYSSGWYCAEASSNAGNPYPTHGLGPMCLLLDINRSDRLTELVSMSTARGGINTSLIRTRRGRTLMLQYDTVTPRPYNRLQTVCGENGYISKYPLPTVQISPATEALTGAEAEAFLDKYRHPLVDRYTPDAIRLGIDNMMNYIMDRRLIECVSAGQQFDISPADAALWSSIAPLSHLSASQGSKPVAIPDFVDF